MRRSLAPSQQKLKPLLPPPAPSSSCGQKKASNAATGGDDEMTIRRMPMFGFLEIPDNLNKQFKIPSGCIITEK